ncbi:MAG: ABC transporter permease [Chloroflexota bacterium]
MIADILTIATKEWRELLMQRGNARGGWLSLIVMVGVFGIYLPLNTGRVWVESPASLAIWLWVPLFLTSNVVADSFAGERERHTLETLLASRLSDSAILMGKVCAAIGYAWGLTLVMLVVGLVTVNVAFARGELLMYPPTIAGSVIGLTFLSAGLVACVGVLVSLRAATVRQAAQTLSIAIMVLLFVPVLGLQALPGEIRREFGQLVSRLDLVGVVVAAGLTLLVVDAILLAAALARFRRAKLILD